MGGQPQKTVVDAVSYEGGASATRACGGRRSVVGRGGSRRRVVRSVACAARLFMAVVAAT